ncbi:MAG TPA: SDR family oxidoreductase [Gammaproteobacteria bacterium]|nr:SDR family oxidoreductase [Gammaproteobacteria bacterium]
MKVLVLGAEGFIGRHLVAALEARGHTVLRGVRAPAAAHELAIDFMRDWQAEQWRSRLQRDARGTELVVNAVGLFKETPQASFDGVHVRAPAALAAACAAVGCGFVHVSALGADATSAVSAYQASKGRGEDAVRAALPAACIVRPSLVFGADGASARFFTLIATLPLIVLPDTRGARLQPIHVEDLVAALVALIETRGPGIQVLVGPRALRWREWFDCLRRGLGLGRARALELPRGFDALARAGGALLGTGLVDRAALAMLREGNTADVATTRRLLGRPPRDPGDFVPRAEKADWRRRAELGWLLPVARLAVAATWAWSALVSAGLYPREGSFELLAATGLTGTPAVVALAAGVLVDAVCAVLSLWVPRAWLRPWVWRAQMAVIAVYTLIVTIAMPAFWLHPFGPLLKNLPLLALLWLLARIDEGAARQPAS